MKIETRYSFVIVAIFCVGIAACGSESDAPADDADVQTEDLADEDINCWDLSPDECRDHADRRSGPCFVESLSPFDRDRGCYDHGNSREICLFFEAMGDNSERIVVDPKGQCYWNSTTIYGVPDGWDYNPVGDCSCEVDDNGEFIEGCTIGNTPNSCD